MSHAATPNEIPTDDSTNQSNDIPDVNHQGIPSTATSGKRGKGKKEKKPKKKKLSKKERLRLKKEKEEQERLEQERIEAELRDQREREYEQKKREEQQQRLIEEDLYVQKLRKQRTLDGIRIRKELAATDSWEIYRKCDHFVDVRSQADVNTFITQWRENEETELPNLFDHISQSNKIKNQLKLMMQKAEVSKETDEYSRCKAQIEAINELVQQKMEQITVRHLVFSDKYSGAKNEVLISTQTDGLVFGMWVNLSKNPRIKEIEFPGLSVEIPKSVAMTSLAIRMQMSDERRFDNTYLFLGKQILCDFLQLPAPPKKVGLMVLRQSPQRNSLINITYPLRNVNTGQPPLNFKVQLEPDFISEYVKDATVVMITEDSISSSHISKVHLDQDSNTLSFSSMAVGTFSIALPRYSHFPLKMWELTSTSDSSIEIYIKTRLDVELPIQVSSEGLCSCNSSDDNKSNSVLEFKDLNPVAAFEYLMDHGINLVAPELTEGVQPKSPDLEEVLCQGISDAVTGFIVSWSKWNEMLPSDRAMLIMNEMKTFNEDFDESISESGSVVNNMDNNGNAAKEQEDKNEKQIPNKHKMRAILVKSNHITEVPYTEDLYECNMKPLDNVQIHQQILPAFFERASNEVKERVKNAPTALVDATYYFLKQLRLFSMTKADTEE